MTLQELAEEIRAVNKANGWNVTVPEDWGSTAIPIEELEIGKPHTVDSHTCTSNPIQYWRVFGMLRGEAYMGTGSTSEAAIESCKRRAAADDRNYKIPAIMALQASEVSESLEAFRHDDMDNFLEEQADVLIRVLDCVGAFTDDFDSIVRAKIEKNKTRGYRHGGKRV